MLDSNLLERGENVGSQVVLRMIKDSAKHWWVEYSVTKPYDAMKQFW